MKPFFAIRAPLVCCVLLAMTMMAGSLLIAQEKKNGTEAKPPAAAPATPAASPTKTVNVKAEKVLSVKEAQNGKVRITTVTKAIVTQEDSTFTSDKMVIESEGNVHVFTCTGNPVFTDKETRITSEKVIAHSSPRWAEFSNNVKMVATPKKNGKGEIQGKMGGEPTTVTSDKLSYDYKKKTAQARGNVVVVQKNRTLWAEEGLYDQNEELMTLKGNVRMKNTGEEEIKEMKNAETVTVSLENDWVDIVAPTGGLVEFILEVKDEDDAPKTDAKKDEKADEKKDNKKDETK